MAGPLGRLGKGAVRGIEELIDRTRSASSPRIDDIADRVMRKAQGDKQMQSLDMLERQLMQDLRSEARGAESLRNVDALEQKLMNDLRGMSGGRGAKAVGAGLGAGAAGSAGADPYGSVTGTIEGPRSEMIVKLANLLDSSDTDLDLLGGSSDYLRKLGYGDKIGMTDRLKALLDFL